MKPLPPTVLSTDKLDQLRELVYWQTQIDTHLEKLLFDDNTKTSRLAIERRLADFARLSARLALNITNSRE